MHIKSINLATINYRALRITLKIIYLLQFFFSFQYFYSDLIETRFVVFFFFEPNIRVDALCKQASPLSLTLGLSRRCFHSIQNLGNQENAILKGKSSSIVAPLKRSALGEIGNKVNSVRGTTAFGKTSLLPDALKKTSKHVVAPRAQVKVIAKAEPPVVEVQPVQVAQVQPLPQAREAEPEKASFSSDLLVEDIDQDDAENPSLVSIYSNDIYSHLRDLERQTPIHEEFLTGQQVTPKMRSVLVDWLVEVHQQFHLTQESLYLTIAIIDRFLQVIA